MIVTFRGDEIARARGASLSGDRQKHEDRFVDFSLCMHACVCVRMSVHAYLCVFECVCVYDYDCVSVCAT